MVMRRRTPQGQSSDASHVMDKTAGRIISVSSGEKPVFGRFPIAAARRAG
jgi:hypothetical protein